MNRSLNQVPLLPLAVNGKFVDELLSAEARCFALGLAEAKRRTRRLLALRLDEDVPSEVAMAGFGMGTDPML